MMSGTHPAAIPETTLNTEPAVDYVCGGEGPITVHELLLALQSGGDIRKVRSLSYCENGGVFHTSPAPLIDLNADPDFGEIALTSINEWMAAIAPDKLKRRLFEIVS